MRSKPLLDTRFQPNECGRIGQMSEPRASSACLKSRMSLFFVG